MHIEDEVGDATVGVRNLAECVSRSIGDESLCRGPVVAREKDDLACGADDNMSNLTIRVQQ